MLAFYLLLITPDHNLILGRYLDRAECDRAKTIVELSVKKRGTYYPDLICYPARGL